MALMTYSGLSAKVKAMKGRLMKDEDFYAISSMQSVPEFLSFLKTSSSYSRLFDHVSDETLHRGEIEKLLQLALYDDYARIYTFAGPKQRRFLKIYFQRYEIQIIKAFLHLIFDHRDITFNTKLIPEHFSSQTDIDLNRLAESKSLDDFFETLKGSVYDELLSPLRSIPGSTLFDYELALDIHFFRQLWKSKDKELKSSEFKEITKIYGTQIDLLNILWLYRSKKFYQLTAQEMQEHLIPIYYRLNVPFLQRLIESESLTEFREILGTSFYGKALSEMESSAHESGDALWEMYHQTMGKLRRSAARNNPYSLAVIDEYLYLREEEINRLTTALECIRYSLDASQMMKYVF